MCCLLTLGAGIEWEMQQFATDWTIWRSNFGEREIFRTLPERPWGPHRLPGYSGYRVSSAGLLRSGRGVEHPPHPAPRLKKEYSYTSTHMNLRGLLWGEIYLCIYPLFVNVRRKPKKSSKHLPFTPCIRKQLSLLAEDFQLTTISNCTILWTTAKSL